MVLCKHSVSHRTRNFVVAARKYRIDNLFSFIESHAKVLGFRRGILCRGCQPDFVTRASSGRITQCCEVNRPALIGQREKTANAARVRVVVARHASIACRRDASGEIILRVSCSHVNSRKNAGVETTCDTVSRLRAN